MEAQISKAVPEGLRIGQPESAQATFEIHSGWARSGDEARADVQAVATSFTGSAFPRIADPFKPLFFRNSGRRTGFHSSWNCSDPPPESQPSGEQRLQQCGEHARSWVPHCPSPHTTPRPSGRLTYHIAAAAGCSKAPAEPGKSCVKLLIPSDGRARLFAAMCSEALTGPLVAGRARPKSSLAVFRRENLSQCARTEAVRRATFF